MKDIIIRFVPQSQQTYETLGDYWDKGDHVLFHISDTGNDNYNRAIMHHELWEYFEMIKRGVTAEDTCVFDIANPNADDPGMLPDAPYHREHCQADVIERMCIVMSGEDWALYDEACQKHFEKWAVTPNVKFPRRIDA
jgi:hypothetical protein